MPSELSGRIILPVTGSRGSGFGPLLSPVVVVVVDVVTVVVVVVVVVVAWGKTWDTLFNTFVTFANGSV